MKLPFRVAPTVLMLYDTMASPNHDEVQAMARIHKVSQNYAGPRCPDSLQFYTGATAASAATTKSLNPQLSSNASNASAGNSTVSAGNGSLFVSESPGRRLQTSNVNTTTSTTTNTTTTTTTTTTTNVLQHLGNLSSTCDIEYLNCTQVHNMHWTALRVGFEVVDVDGVAIASVTDPSGLQLIDHVQKVLLPRATAYLHQALQVRPATDLRVQFLSTYCEQQSDGLKFVCAATDLPTCGSDHVPIPASYANGRRVCSNCSKRVALHQGEGIGKCESCQQEADGTSADGTDFFFFVTIRDTVSCTNGITAYASTCIRDQCDRPLFGALNFCRSSLSLDVTKTNEQVSLVIHELIHMLVFSSIHFRYFRNADGTPQVARNSTDELDISGEVRWSCTSASNWEYPDAQGSRIHVDLVAAGLVGLHSERGIDTCPCPIGTNRTIQMGAGCLLPQYGFRIPSCVLKVQTPKVKAAARRHFACPSLQGAELENQDMSKCVIFGSHWEQRLFMHELMAPIFPSVVTDAVVSEVTLALFEDSGWYMPHYHTVDAMFKGATWGFQQGCPFALDRCVNDGQSAFPQHWCGATGGRACSLDRQREAQCSFTNHLSVPSVVSYFATGIAGNLPVADYCPMHQSIISNHVCTQTSSLPAPHSYANFMREIFGPTSRCLASSLHADVPAYGGGTYTVNPNDFVASRPGCFDVSCKYDAGQYSYDVLVADLTSATPSRLSIGTCTADGQILALAGLSGQVTCASPIEVCGPIFASHSYVQRKHYMRWNTTTTTTTTNTTTTLTSTSTFTSTLHPNASTTIDPNAATSSSSNTSTTTLSTTSTTTSTSTTITTTTGTSSTTTNTSTSTTTDPNATFTTTIGTTSTTTIITFPPPPTTTTTSTTTTSTTSTSTTTVTTTTTSNTTFTSTTTTTTSTTPDILSVQGSIALAVYDLVSLTTFLDDMKIYMIIERTIAATAGIALSLIQILSMSLQRRLHESPVASVVESPPRILPARRPPPAPRWLQTTQTFKVDYRVDTVGQGTTAWKMLTSLQSVSMYAMTFQLQQSMAISGLPRSYKMAILNVTALPIIYPMGPSPVAAPSPPHVAQTSGCRRLVLRGVSLVIWWLHLSITAFRFACGD